MPEPASRYSQRLTFLLEFLSSGCLALMAVLVIAQVVLRYVFNDPLTWSEELARIVFIYLTFLGIAAAYGRRRHMFVDSFIVLLPPRVKKVLEFSVILAASVFLLVILGVTVRSMAGLIRSEITTPALEISMAWIYLIMAIGLSALIVQMWIVWIRERRG